MPDFRTSDGIPGRYDHRQCRIAGDSDPDVYIIVKQSG